MKQRTLFYGLAIPLALMMILISQTAAFAETHIYINQATGVNSSTTAGTETSPFKSITYAMMTMKNKSAPDPWVVHIKAGTYDADTAKAASEREIFPITLRQGMTIQGDDGAANCIISGAFNANSQAALLKGDTLTGITIKNLTLTKMTRTTGNGAAAELLKCAGVMQGCVVSMNPNGGSYCAVYLTVPANSRFDVLDNTFSNNGNNNSSMRGLLIDYVQTGFTGNISGNTFSSNSYGGFYVSGAFTGDISGNTFSGNSGYGEFVVSGAFTGNVSGNTFIGNSGGYAGFATNSTVTGDISGNTFSGNTPRGFYAGGKVTGHISSNVFSRNSDSYSKGLGFLLDSDGGDNAIVSNNFFLYNSRTDTSTTTLNGAGIYSDQNVTIVNNTFYGSKTGESAINISSYAPNSVIKNNIFASVHTPIWEQTELNLAITNNDFYGTTDILHRNNQPQGNDADFIAMLLPDFQNNGTWVPGLVGESAATGVWSADPVYDPATRLTTLTDSTKSWTPGRWKGAMLRVNPSTVFQHFPIVNNTANQITVMGNLTVTTLVNNGNNYTIDDYHLAIGSQNIDTGAEVTSLVTTDFDGQTRPAGNGFDIGADEFSSGNGPTKGYLQVTLSPQAAITAGAQWTIVGSGVWRNSGNIVELTAGTYSVEFKAITGYTKPANASTTVAVNQTATLTGTYTVAAYTVSGSVKTASGAGISGVTMSLSTGATTSTDNSVYYSFSNIAAGSSGTVTPSKIGYMFTPTSLPFSNISANQTLNFTGVLLTYTVVFQAGTGGAISGTTTQTISSGGSCTQVTATPATGYAFVNWTGSNGFTSTSNPLTVTNVTANMTITANFQLQAIVYYTISGSVKTAAGAAISGVLLMPNTGSTATSDSSGNYTLSVASGWTGTVTPYKSGYTFSSSLSYSNVTANKTGQNYIGAVQTPTTYTISGSVQNTNNTGVSGVTLTFSNSGGTASSDSTGFYSRSVSSGWSGTVTPSKSGCTFTPASQAFGSLTSNQVQDFSADCGELNGWITRSLPASYMPGVKFTVTLNATPPSGTSNYSVEDKSVNGWTVSDISGGGLFDSITKKVKFGPFQDGSARTLTYSVTPPSTATGDGTFTGTGLINATSSIIGGEAVIPKGLQTHPADTDGNFVMTGLEMNTYLYAWLNFASWTLPPNPIPMNYVSKAISLWQYGESYKTDTTKGSPPLCWVNTAVVRSRRDNTSVTAVRKLPATPYTAGTAITVTISISASADGYVVEDTLPSGWTASGMSDGGTTAGGMVRFGIPNPGNQAKTLSYQAKPPAGATGVQTFSGKVALAAAEIPIAGNQSVSDHAAVPGDLDNSGTVDLGDAVIALKILSGIDVGSVPPGADVNGDHKIGLPEVIYILQKVAGLRPSAI